jgi:predicted nucleic acid-binding protein
LIYLLDTSAWLAHYLREPEGEKIQALFKRDGSELVVASVSLTEFARRVGTLRPDVDVQAVLNDYLSVFSDVVAIDRQIAQAAFALGEACSGRLPLVDSLIAASAQSLSAVLVHRDAHFSNIPARMVKQMPLG